MKPTPFRYERAESAEHAVALLAEHGDDAKILAGGQSLVPMIALHLAQPAVLVDINRVPGLADVTAESGVISIGALTRHREVEESELLQREQPVFAAAGSNVGHYPIRVRGTFGGSLAHADPASEWCAVALLLDAEVDVLGPGGRRSIPVDSLFDGFLTTTVRDDELLLGARLRRGRRAAFTELSRRRGDFALVLAGVAVEEGPDGSVTAARVVLGGVDASVVRSPDAEEALVGSPLSTRSASLAGEAAAAAVDPPSDVHAAGWYRRQLVQVLVRRCAESLVPVDAAGPPAR